jgi:hypothetical protein
MPDTTLTSPLGNGTGDVKGNVSGGRQPIAGAAIYLYGAPNTAYSFNNSTPPTPISLLGNVVSPLSPDGKCDSSVKEPLYIDTGGNCYYLTGGTSGNTLDSVPGEFQLTGLYHCNVSSPNASPGSLPGQQVWLYAIGGYPGVVGGTTTQNVQAGLAAALGTCNASTNNFSTYTYLYVNEVSTVAFAYSVAGFASDATHVSAPSTNYATGLTNAFGNAAQLYDIFGGSDPGDHGARHQTPNALGTNKPSEGNGTDPYYLINSLANVLAACINSADNPAYSSLQCRELFQDVYGTGYTSYPIDTVSAMIFIAQNPSSVNLGTSVSNLLGINNGSAPWSPNYSTGGAPAEPNDLTAAISYTGVTNPTGIAIDQSGNAYVTSSGGTVSELSSKGIVTGTSSNLGSSISYITIDSSGNIWTPSQATSNVYELSSGLSLLTTELVTNGTFTLSTTSHQIAADQSGVVYIADAGNSLIWVVKKNGTIAVYNDKAVAKDTCTAGVTGVAFDPTLSGFIWSVGDGTTDNICRLSGGSPSTDVDLLLATPAYVAVDSFGDGWATASSSKELFEVEANDNVVGPYNGGGLEDPTFLTVDGDGDIWIINNADSDSTTGTTAPSLSEFSNGGTPITPSGSKFVAQSGYQFGLLSMPSGIAIDQSGDVWVTNQSGPTNGNTVFELIGAAIPTKAPLVTGPGQLP